MGGWVVQICDGATMEEREAWRLRPAKEFRMLNQSNCYTLPRVDNAVEYGVCTHPPRAVCRSLSLSAPCSDPKAGVCLRLRSASGAALQGLWDAVP